MSFVERRTGGHGFQVFVPPASAGNPPPAILFLHGKGQSGTRGEQVDIGLPRILRERPQDWPFLVVMPQKPDAETLWPEWTGLIDAVLAAVDSEFPTDPARRYLTGLSQGGNGTLRLARSLRWRFAAIASVCGWADPIGTARQLKDMPTWLFHGSRDDIVPASCSAAIADCMARPDLAGEPLPRLTLYPGLTHNSWDVAYCEPALPGWFLSHRAG